MNTGVWHQVGLELVQIDVEGTIKSQRRGDGTDNLSNEAVQMLEVRLGNVEIAAANIVHGFVVNQKCAVGVLNCAVGGENGIVGLDDGRRDARSGIDGKFKLALLSVVGGEALQQKGTKTRSGTTTERVENQEALEGRAVVCKFVSTLSKL